MSAPLSPGRPGRRERLALEQPVRLAMPAIPALPASQATLALQVAQASLELPETSARPLPGPPVLLVPQAAVQAPRELRAQPAP